MAPSPPPWAWFLGLEVRDKGVEDSLKCSGSCGRPHCLGEGSRVTALSLENERKAGRPHPPSLSPHAISHLALGLVNGLPNPAAGGARVHGGLDTEQNAPTASVPWGGRKIPRASVNCPNPVGQPSFLLSNPLSPNTRTKRPLTLAPPTQAPWLRPPTRVGAPSLPGCTQSTAAPVKGRDTGFLDITADPARAFERETHPLSEAHPLAHLASGQLSGLASQVP